MILLLTKHLMDAFFSCGGRGWGGAGDEEDRFPNNRTRQIQTSSNSTRGCERVVILGFTLHIRSIGSE